MARTKNIIISGLNIVTQPHTPEDYVWFFKEIFKSKRYINVNGSDCIMLIDLEYINPKKPLDGLKGKFLKFSRIDINSDWADIESGKVIENGETPDIPPNLQPNASKVPFVFYPKGKDRSHKLFFISRSRDSLKKKYITLSPKHLKKFFEKVTLDNSFKEKFKTINITVLPSASALDNVLSLHFIRKLELVIYAPNPDVSDFRQKMMERLNKMNGKKYKESVISNGDSIEPDEELKRDAQIASENGYVISYGRDENNLPASRSTVQQPLADTRKVQSDNLEAERTELFSYRYRE